jgi:hypothetical protein
MNQQQKKFAITRLYNILCLKARVLEVSSAALNNTHAKLRKITGAQFAIAFKRGEIPLKKGNLGGVDITSNTDLNELFDFNSLYAKAVEFKRDNSLFSCTWRHCNTASKAFSLKDPVTTSQVEHFQYFDEPNALKVAAMQKALAEAADCIILGSDAEAMEAIANMEQRQF